MQSVTKEPSIAILVPCYNEETTVRKVVEDFSKVLPSAQIYVFDNNSTDRTAEFARSAGAHVVSSPQQGKGFVIRHMFQVVEADIYIMVDGDDTYPADQLTNLLTQFYSAHADMLVGVRLEGRVDNAFRLFHSFGNKLVAFIISKLWRTKVTDVLSGYRIFSRDFVKNIPLQSEGFEVETELTLQALTKQFRVVETPISYGCRPENSFSKLNTYSDGYLILKSIFTIFKDYKPLIFFSLLSFVLLVLTIGFGIVPINDYLQHQWVYHVPRAILAASLGILAMLSFFVGLILDTLCKYQFETFQIARRSRPLRTERPNQYRRQESDRDSRIDA